MIVKSWNCWLPLDERGKPLAEANPALRFVVYVNNSEEDLADLKDNVFKRNAFVTVVGELSDPERVELTNGQTQLLPIVSANDFYRWSYLSKESRNNGVSLGISITFWRG